jgi:general secretion pathway protein M
MSNFLTKAFEPQIKQANSKLQQMPEKDRQALLALSVFAAVLIFVYVIYLPLEAYHDRARQNAEVSQELYQWLKSKEKQAKAVSKKPKGAGSSNDSLLTQVTETSKNNGLSLKRVQPEGNDKIRLWLEDVPFNQVLIALDKLQSERGLKIEEVSIDRKAPGKVDARATISR